MRRKQLACLLLLAVVALAATLLLSSDSRANPDVSPDDDPAWGPADAPVTIVEFGDYQCPYCKRFYDETLPAIKAAYESRVRFVYRDFPLASIHPYAQKAAEASECADDQGRFWDYHDALWANQEALDIASLKAYAAQLGLDMATFDDCLDSGKNAQEVQKDYSDGVSYGVPGTPTFFINGAELVGAQPFSSFQTAIDPLLALAPTATPTVPSTATPAPTSAPRGQLYFCPPANGWSVAVWSGMEGAPMAEALSTCGEDAVTAAYSLDRSNQIWQRYFPDRPDIRNTGLLGDMHAIIVLGSASAVPGPAAPPSNSFVLRECPLAGKWAISTWDGPNHADIDLALATCWLDVEAAYALDPQAQAWRRYFKGRPEISDLLTIDSIQGILTLGVSTPP